MHKTKRILSLILLASMLLTACGKDGKMYGSGKEGYTRLDDVDGISFELVSSVARNATAITNISEDMEFEADQTYLYKDGENAYFIFNMRRLYVQYKKVQILTLKTQKIRKHLSKMEMFWESGLVRQRRNLNSSRMKKTVFISL